MCNKDIWLAVQTAISRKNSLLFPKSQFPHAGKKPGGKCSPLFVGMGLSTCSLDARSVIGVFDGAWVQVLESEHMLGLLAQRVLSRLASI